MNIDNIIPSTLKVTASEHIDITLERNAVEKNIAHLIEKTYEEKEEIAPSGERR